MFCRVDGWEGELTLDEHEVAAVRWEAPADVFREAEKAPDRFTPWFLDEMHSLDWFGAKEADLPKHVATSSVGVSALLESQLVRR